MLFDPLLFIQNELLHDIARVIVSGIVTVNMHDNQDKNYDNDFLFYFHGGIDGSFILFKIE